MALNQFDNNRNYTKYKRHVDESKERISATTVNQIQKGVTDNQLEINRVKDTAFSERVYTIFENNKYVNSMFIDDIKSGEYINMLESSNPNLLVDYERSQLRIRDTYREATMTSVVVYSVKGEDVEMNDFFLISSEEIPTGASISWKMESFNGEQWPIAQNRMKLPMHLSKNLVYGFKIICEMHANALGESPIVNGYAVLYWDAAVEKDLGMTNPDLARFP